MNSYEVRQDVFAFIETELLSNPLTDGYATLNKLYENLEAKPKNIRNFLSMEKEDLPSTFSLNCKELHVQFIVNVFMENEVLSEKFASYFVDRFSDKKTDEKLLIQNCESIARIIPYEQNMFLKQVKFEVRA